MLAFGVMLELVQMLRCFFFFWGPILGRLVLQMPNVPNFTLDICLDFTLINDMTVSTKFKLLQSTKFKLLQTIIGVTTEVVMSPKKIFSLYRYKPHVIGLLVKN